MTLTRVNASPLLLPHEIEDLFIRPTLELSIAAQVSTIVHIDAPKFRVPVMTATPTASWVRESEEIPVTEAAFSDVTIEPAKLAVLSIISSELAEDTSPTATEAIGKGMAIDLAKKLDAAYFGSKGASTVQPPGLGDLTSATTVTAGASITNQDPFVDAIAAADAAFGKISFFVANPADITKLAKLKQGTGSQVPLLQLDPTAVASRVILGVPLLASPAVTPGIIWGIPKATSYLVMRTDATVDIDGSVFFTSDRVALRGKARAAFGWSNPAAVVKITTSP